MTKIWQLEQLFLALNNIIIDYETKDSDSFSKIEIDSRSVFAPRGTNGELENSAIFLALKGENNDGHNFLDQAFINGASLAIIDSREVFAKYKDQSQVILVTDTFLALNELAKYKRINSKAKIIAVTGSAGKTSVKEMLKLVFSSEGKTYATSGNLNNHIGLPLTLSNMPQDAEFVILEMGMNHLNEINELSNLAKPDIAVITNVVPAHIGNFNNEEEIAIAKSEIFAGLNKETGVVLLNCDNPYFEFLRNRAGEFYKINQKNVFSFGKNVDADYKLNAAEVNDATQLTVKVKIKNKEINYKISSSNKTTAFNSLIAVSCLDLLGCDLEKSLQSLVKITAGKGRGAILEIVVNNKNITIIDDTYNANIASMAAGIEYLADLKISLQKKRSVAILGDMLELGKDSVKLHQKIAKYLEEFKIDLTLLVGSEMKHLAAELGEKNCQCFENSAQLAKEVEKLLNDQDILLIKGSRGIKMENVTLNLLEKSNF